MDDDSMDDDPMGLAADISKNMTAAISGTMSLRDDELAFRKHLDKEAL